MDRSDNIKDCQNYILFGLNKNEATQLYNMPENENNKFLIQFKQLITYFNFRRKIKEALKAGIYVDNDHSNISVKERNNEGYIQNHF